MEKALNTLKRVSALVTVVVILVLYVTTLVLALMNNSYTKKFFMASLVASFMLPIFIYLIFWIAKVLRKYNPNNKKDKPEISSDKKNMQEK